MSRRSARSSTGNLRFAGVSLEVTGDVARNITVACGEATLAASSKNVYFIGETLYFSGSTGDLTVEAVEVSLSGRVEGDVDVQADRVTFLNGFSCGGTIRVTAKEVDFGPVEAAAVDWNEVTTGSEIGGRLLDLVYNIPAQILIVLLLLFLFRRPFGNLCAGFNRDKVKIVFTGLAGLFIPILAIFLLLTVIGMRCLCCFWRLSIPLLCMRAGRRHPDRRHIYQYGKQVSFVGACYGCHHAAEAGAGSVGSRDACLLCACARDAAARGVPPRTVRSAA